MLRSTAAQVNSFYVHVVQFRPQLLHLPIAALLVYLASLSVLGAIATDLSCLSSSRAYRNFASASIVCFGCSSMIQ